LVDRGEIEGNGIQGEVFRAWSMTTGRRSSHRVKHTPNEGVPIRKKGKVLLSDYFGSTPQGEDNMKFTQFLELFQSFFALRSLYITKSLLRFVVPALQELAGERRVAQPT
jgi:hypothetical protein